MQTPSQENGNGGKDRYRAIWEHLIEFSRRKRRGDKFSADLAARFVEEYRVRGEPVG